MTNEPRIDFDQLAKEWRGLEQAPTVTLSDLHRRLRRRWLWLLADAASIVVVGAILIWSSLITQGLTGWLFWGFFAGLYVVLCWKTISIGLSSFRPHEQTPAGVVDLAWRNAHASEQGGRLAIRASLLALVFVYLFVLANVVLFEDSLHAITSGDRLFALGFTTLWCGLFIALGRWQIEKGRHQKLQLELLRRDLQD